MKTLSLIGGLLLTFASNASPVAQMQMVGQAELRVWFWDIYSSSLYSPTGEYTPDEYPLALAITYKRDIKAKNLVEQTAEEWQKQGFEQQRYQPWLSKVSELWPDVNDGDQLVLHVNADKTSEFYYNGEALGQIDDTEFGPAFLAIWLAEECSYPKLRKQLIGMSD